MATLAAILLVAQACGVGPASSSGPVSPSAGAGAPATTTPVSQAPSVAPPWSPSSRPAIRLEQAIRPMVATWRPSGPTALVARAGNAGSAILVAVPIRTGTAVELVELADAQSWSISRDGRALAIAVRSSDASARLASFDPLSGAARWLTPEDGRLVSDPVWAVDGSAIYFVRMRLMPGGSPLDLGIWRIAPDGSGEQRVTPPVADPGLGVTLRGITPDGAGLLWGRLGLEGSSLEIYDLRSATSRAFGCCLARALSFRSERPRALVLRHTGTTSELVLWDDLAPRIVRTIAGQDARVEGASWSPDGRALVAAMVFDGVGGLVRMREDGTAPVSVIAAPASDPLWIGDSIVYLLSSAADPVRTAVAVVPAAGGPPRVLYRGPGLSGLSVVP